MSLLDQKIGTADVGGTLVSTTVSQQKYAGPQILNNPRLAQQLNISIPYTQNTPALAATPIFSASASGYGSAMYSFAMIVDANTQKNYYFMLEIQGITISTSSQWFQFPTSLGYNPIAEGIAWQLAPNALIQLYAYNFNSSTTDGTLSVSINFNDFGA